MSNRDALFTARWHLANNQPVPAGAPLQALYDLMTPVIGPMPGVVTPPAASPAPIPVPPAGAKKAKVALVIGHNSRQPGAWVGGDLDLSEYAYHSQVSAAILDLVDESELTVSRFFREFTGSYASEIDRCYAKVNAWQPDLVVEMHFNGGGGNFCMMVAAKGSAKSSAASVAMLEVFSRRLSIPIWSGGSPRGVDGRSRGDRGGRSVWASSAPSVLTEPFFGDHSQHAAKVAEIGILGMAAVYVEAIRAAVASI
jgi:N-acetylmuramoyl-L-alanine amidase